MQRPPTPPVTQTSQNTSYLDQMPSYAPDLDPVEGLWSLLRRSSQANTAFTDPDHLMRTLRHGLRQIQYRSNLIDGCLAETGLTLTTSRQQAQ